MTPVQTHWQTTSRLAHSRQFGLTRDSVIPGAVGLFAPVRSFKPAPMLSIDWLTISQPHTPEAV